MSINPEVRAADADREHVAAVLREHTAEGRLTLDEMLERSDEAYTARTLGDLQRLVADLPEPPAPSTASRPVPPARNTHAGAAAQLRTRWAIYCSISLLCVVIWLGTSLAAGTVEYFWPVWVVGPWGAALLAKTLGRSAGRGLAARGGG